MPIELPPLRQRTEDIPALADFFLKRYAKKNQKNIKGFHPQALMLPDDFETVEAPLSTKGGQSLKNVEREAIRTTLERTDGNKSRIAKILGIARQTLINKIKAYGL